MKIKTILRRNVGEQNRLTEIKMVIVDVVAEAVGLIAAKYFYDKVERKE